MYVGMLLQAHADFLSSLADTSLPRLRTLLLLEVCTLWLHLSQQVANNPEVLQELFSQIGAQYNTLQPGVVADLPEKQTVVDLQQQQQPDAVAHLQQGASSIPEQCSHQQHEPQSTPHRQPLARPDHDSISTSRSSKHSRKRKKHKHKKHSSSKRRRHNSTDDSNSSSLLDPHDYDEQADLEPLVEAEKFQGPGATDAVDNHAVSDPASRTAPVVWRVCLPGQQAYVSGSSADMVDAVACYACRQWVRRIVVSNRQ